MFRGGYVVAPEKCYFQRVRSHHLCYYVYACMLPFWFELTSKIKQKSTKTGVFCSFCVLILALKNKILLSSNQIRWPNFFILWQLSDRPEPCNLEKLKKATYQQRGKRYRRGKRALRWRCRIRKHRSRQHRHMCWRCRTSPSHRKRSSRRRLSKRSEQNRNSHSFRKTTKLLMLLKRFVTLQKETLHHSS